jgi:hypothetical protein
VNILKIIGENNPGTPNVNRHISNLFDYLEERQSVSVSYASHLNRALRRGFAAIRYEDLLNDTYQSLVYGLEHIDETDIDFSKLNRVVENNSIEHIRKHGKHGTNVRKGKPGEWREIFTSELNSKCLKKWGNAMSQFGYVF